MAAVKYKRILLKLSGEALAAGGEGIEKVEEDYAAEIARLSGVKQ